MRMFFQEIAFILSILLVEKSQADSYSGSIYEKVKASGTADDAKVEAIINANPDQDQISAMNKIAKENRRLNEETKKNAASEAAKDTTTKGPGDSISTKTNSASPPSTKPGSPDKKVNVGDIPDELTFPGE